MAPAARAQESARIDEVVVTASKRETRLLDTPMSITVIDKSTLKAVNADSFSDIASLVPGLTYTDSGPGNKRYALRGLQSAGEPEVALYYDEVPVSGLPGASLDTGDSQPDFKLVDLERIEVLRGPQGTLYGNGAMGGAIRVISHRPDLDRFEGAAQASSGVTDGGDPSWRLDGMVNAPLIEDRLAIRLVGYYRDEGGWIDAVAKPGIKLPQIVKDNTNWEHTAGGRASVSLQVTPRWNITGIAYYQALHTGASSDTYPDYTTPDDRYVSKAYVQTPWREKAQMYNLISTDDLGWATVLATGSYQRRTLDRIVDTTRFLIGQFGCTEATWDLTCFGPPLAPAASYAYETVDAWSGELRLVSKSPGPLQWTAGAFLQDATTTRRTQVVSVDADGYVDFGPTTGAILHRLFERDNVDTFNQYAFFAEGTYDLIGSLKATVGLRWFHSDRTDQQVIVQQFFPGQPTGPQPFQRFDQGALFKKYELSYDFDGQGLIYVQAAQGFRAGGPNFPGGFNLSAPPYAADSVWDYEAGWKAALDHGKIYWTGAVFHIDWSNLQQLVPTALFSYIANAGKAQSDGVETEINYHLTTALTVTGGATYNNARLVGPQPVQSDPTLQLESGDKLANVPDWTAHTSLTYVRPLPNGYDASARVDLTYASSRGDLVTTRSPAYFQIPSSTLANLHLALDSHRTWRLALDIDNLGNVFAPASAKALDSSLVQTESAARPRTVSVSLALSY